MKAVRRHDAATHAPPVAEVVASGVGPTWRYGVEPGLAVHKVEDHSDALLFWLRQGTRGRRVLHIDTHDDSRLIDPAVLPEVERSVAAEDWTPSTIIPGSPFNRRRNGSTSATSFTSAGNSGWCAKWSGYCPATVRTSPT